MREIKKERGGERGRKRERKEGKEGRKRDGGERKKKREKINFSHRIRLAGTFSGILSNPDPNLINHYTISISDVK